MGQRPGLVKLVSAGIFCNLYRLLRFIPNNDPIMGAMLPFSRAGSALSSFLFPFLTMASFDLLTARVGIWTAVTALTYGALGLAFHLLYRKAKKLSIWTYLASGVAGVLAFDFVTGPVMSSLMFRMTFWDSLVGQIPFTLLHLASVSFFVALLTPLIDRTIVGNPALDDRNVVKSLGLAKA